MQGISSYSVNNVIVVCCVSYFLSFQWNLHTFQTRQVPICQVFIFFFFGGTNEPFLWGRFWQVKNCYWLVTWWKNFKAINREPTESSVKSMDRLVSGFAKIILNVSPTTTAALLCPLMFIHEFLFDNGFVTALCSGLLLCQDFTRLQILNQLRQVISTQICLLFVLPSILKTTWFDHKLFLHFPSGCMKQKLYIVCFLWDCDQIKCTVLVWMHYLQIWKVRIGGPCKGKNN